MQQINNNKARKGSGFAVMAAIKSISVGSVTSIKKIDKAQKNERRTKIRE